MTADPTERIPATAPDQRGVRWDRWDRWSDLAYAVAAAVAAATILLRNRDQWFYYDDFVFAFQRDLAHPSTFLSAHYGHLTALPGVVFQAMYRVVGLRAYWPYQVVLVATHVAVATAVRALLRRMAVPGVLATSAAVVLLFYGSGRENLAWAFQTTLNGSLALGFLALLLVDHDGAADHRDAWAGVALAGAVACSNMGLFLAGAAVLVVILRRGVVATVRVVVPPILVLGLWRAFAPPGTAAEAPAELGPALDWARGAWWYGFDGLSHLPPVAAVLVVVVLVAVVGLAREVVARLRAADLQTDDLPRNAGLDGGSAAAEGPAPGRRGAGRIAAVRLGDASLPVALVVLQVGVALGLGRSRGGFEFGPTTPRYAYLMAAVTLPVVGWALSRVAASRRPLVLVGGALLLVGLPVNVARIGPSNTYDRGKLGDPDLVVAMAQAAGTHGALPGYDLDLGMTTSGLVDAYRAGRLPNRSPSAAERARALLLVSVGAPKGADGRCRAVAPDRPVRLRAGDRISTDAEHLLLSSAAGGGGGRGGTGGGEALSRGTYANGSTRGLDVLVGPVTLWIEPTTPGAEVRVCERAAA